MRQMIILSLAGLLLGCQSLQIEKPTASVKGMTVKDVNTSGFTMNFDVDVANPNSVALPFANADYKLALAGVQLVDGKVKPDGAIPAKGSRSVAVPVTLTYDNLLAAKDALVKSGGNFEYALDAGISVDTGAPILGNLRVPLKYSGKLPLKDILSNPSVLLRSSAAKKLAAELFGSIFGM